MNESWANWHYPNASAAWDGLYEGLCREGQECSPRGKKIRETLGCNIYIHNVHDNLVLSTYRGLSPIYMAKEYFWYKEGSRDPQNAPRSEFWKSIANEDDGLVNSNYGHWLFEKKDSRYPELSVFDATVKLLKDDPDTRHALIQIPIMPFRARKDTPCTSHIQFFIREDKLFATVYMRSCDVCCGFPYDIFQFTMWQIELAERLGIYCGWLRFTAGSLHVYEEDFIENREWDFTYTNADLPVCKKSSEVFLQDLEKLRNFNKSTTVDDFVTEEIRYMFKNRKLWKRGEW